MDKLQKNIAQLVAKKALKNIHNIVQKEDRKEVSEIYWARIIIAIIFIIFGILLVLKYS